MDIKNVRDLAKIIDLCRKKGVSDVKITDNSVEFKMTPEAPSRKVADKDKTEFPPIDQPYTDEQIAMWSVPGFGEN